MSDADIQRAIDRSFFWRRLAVSFAADLLLIGGALYFFGGDGDLSLMPFIVGVLALWALQIVLMIKNFFAAWASLAFFEGKLLEASFLQILRVNKIPPPTRRAARFDYFAELADDPDAPPSDRVKAAGLYGAWTAVMRLRGATATVSMSGAWDRALLAYRNEMRSAAED